MIVDASAVIAILADEADAARFDRAIAASPAARMSVANALEVTMVAEGRGGPAAGYAVDRYFREMGIELVPVTLEQFAAARDAWRRFGRGSHPAGLNFGDCFAYALADVTGEPLLFKGDDFARTDVTAA